VSLKFSVLADNVEAALEVAEPWDSFADMMRANAAICAADVGVQQAVARGPLAWEYAAAELDRLRTSTDRMIVRAQEAGVMRQDFGVDDIPMLMSGLTATMNVPDYDWRRHLEIILAGLRVVA
jgi:Transcriptional regulator SbtR-like, C-terminal domain